MQYRTHTGTIARAGRLSAVALACLWMSGDVHADAVDDESWLEQSLAHAAQREGARSPPPGELRWIQGIAPTGGPLFAGVDDATVPSYVIDPATGKAAVAFLGTQVWGAAYDRANHRVFFNSGAILHVWEVGGAVSTLGPVTFEGANMAMVGLAFFAGQLYASKNISNEAIYLVNPATLEATIAVDYADAELDLGGIAFDPRDGTLYGTNDTAPVLGTGLFRINVSGTATLVVPYPLGQTDIDGLAIGEDGIAYLIVDQEGFIYRYDLDAGIYLDPIPSPWSSSETFVGGTWIDRGGAIFSNGFETIL